MRVTRLHRITVTAALLAATTLAPKWAATQAPAESVFQVEVTDSIGLPLPNAKIEWFTYMPGGIWREWVEVAPNQLEPGLHLLRFSHEGYRGSTFSVPLVKGRRVSLRVRLSPDSAASSAARDVVEAREVRAIGLVLEGDTPRDFLGTRRVIERAAIERAQSTRFSEVLRRTSGSGVMVLPSSGGRFSVRVGGRTLCRAGIMVDGNPARMTTFSGFDEMYHSSEPEAIEIVERPNAIPFSFRRSDMTDCGLLLVWLRGR